MERFLGAASISDTLWHGPLEAGLEWMGKAMLERQTKNLGFVVEGSVRAGRNRSRLVVRCMAS